MPESIFTTARKLGPVVDERIDAKLADVSAVDQTTTMSGGGSAQGDESGGTPTETWDEDALTGVKGGVIDQAIANNATENPTLGAVASISGALIGYNCKRGANYEGGILMVYLTGAATAAVLRTTGNASCGLTLGADVNGGNLRLNITTDAAGNAADFRGTFLSISI